MRSREDGFARLPAGRASLFWTASNRCACDFLSQPMRAPELSSEPRGMARRRGGRGRSRGFGSLPVIDVRDARRTSSSHSFSLRCACWKAERWESGRLIAQRPDGSYEAQQQRGRSIRSPEPCFDASCESVLVSKFGALGGVL